MNPYLAVAQTALRLIGGIRAAIFLALAIAFLLSGLWYKSEALRVKADWAKANTAAIVAQARAARLAAEIAKARQEAATKAADEARDRNDTKIPEVRAASQGRVARAADPALPAADQLQDDRAALEGYGAAADSLRGTRPR